jgi:hypothetical protein
MGGVEFDIILGTAAHLRKSDKKYGASVLTKPRRYLNKMI